MAEVDGGDVGAKGLDVKPNMQGNSTDPMNSNASKPRSTSSVSTSSSNASTNSPRKQSTNSPQKPSTRSPQKASTNSPQKQGNKTTSESEPDKKEEEGEIITNCTFESQGKYDDDEDEPEVNPH